MKDERRTMHAIRFEYAEAIHNPETTPEEVRRLEDRMGELQKQLYESTPRAAYGGSGGHGCW